MAGRDSVHARNTNIVSELFSRLKELSDAISPRATSGVESEVDRVFTGGRPKGTRTNAVVPPVRVNQNRRIAWPLLAQLLLPKGIPVDVVSLSHRKEPLPWCTIFRDDVLLPATAGNEVAPASTINLSCETWYCLVSVNSVKQCIKGDKKVSKIFNVGRHV